jgi:upstream activation factor subunit UAF30
MRKMREVSSLLLAGLGRGLFQQDQRGSEQPCLSPACSFVPKNTASNLCGLEVIRIAEEIHMPKAAAGKAKTNSAFMKPMQPSEELAKIVGPEPLPRSEVTKKVWAHIKKNKLQNPENKREIIADDKLQPVFNGKKLDMFQMTKAINKHLS